MKYASLGILFMLLAFSSISGQALASGVSRIDPGHGFSYPYYLYVPPALHEPGEKAKLHSFIVIPNNTGQINDDLQIHEADVKRKIAGIGAALHDLNTPVLMPVFPRPAAYSTIYTHSLDRDTMITGQKEFSRLDLQLLAMIDDARRRLKDFGVATEDKVVMQGYSASGMFVNRFVFLHPERVKAAVIGAPGGWAIAPAAKYHDRDLPYPAGVQDLRSVSGRNFNVKAVRKVPLLMILGAEDTNDAVPMGDAYDKRESGLVIELFGKTPVERWPKTVSLYTQAKLNAEFKLYPGTGHKMSPEMRDDTIAFLRRHVR